MAMPAEDSFQNGWALPSHDEAEQALLGAILADNRVFDRVADFLAPEHFADATHAKIFMTCGHLINQGKQANAVTLKGFFDHTEALEEVGGAKYLAELQANFVTAINALDYGRIVHDCWVRRQLIGLGARLSREAHTIDAEVDGLSLAEEAQDVLTDLLEAGQREGGLEGAQSLLMRVAEETEAIRKGEREPGLQTGLTDLDRLTGGLQREDLIILAGRPSMGKTALATKIAVNVARRLCRQTGPDGQRIEQPQPVGFFSLEMSAEALIRRIACDAAEVDYASTLQERGLSDADYQRFIDACMEMRGIPLMIDGTPRLSPAQIHARALGMKRRHGLSLIIVDHLGHVTPPHRSDKRYQDLGDITKALKATAKRLGVPVILLCQLNRAVESRDDKRPTLADLRESGQIEEDADVVMFCYREHYYVKRAAPQQRDGEAGDKFAERTAAWGQRCSRCVGLGDVIIAKQRNGSVDTAQLRFDDRFMRWGDLARQDRLEGMR